MFQVVCFYKSLALNLGADFFLHNMKFRNQFLFVFTFFVLSNCQKDDKPSYILDKDKMVPLLVDLHLTEAFVNSNYPMSDSARYVYKKMEDSIFKARGLDQPIFDSSMAYYKRNIKLMDEIYVSVVDSLSLREGLQK